LFHSFMKDRLTIGFVRLKRRCEKRSRFATLLSTHKGSADGYALECARSDAELKPAGRRRGMCGSRRTTKQHSAESMANHGDLYVILICRKYLSSKASRFSTTAERDSMGLCALPACRCSKD
jgi:hypothetical protein